LLRDPNRAVRREAGLALPVDDPAVMQELLALTREGDAALRDDGALLLWRAADDEEVQKRLLELTRDYDDRVRSTAVRQLAKAVGDPRIRARMMELIDDPSDYVRVHAVDALAEDLSNAESRAAIVSRLDAGEVDVQVRAIIAAAKLVGDRSVVEAIMIISRKSPDALVRAACAKSLREAAASDDAACERLIELTRDPERSVHWEAVDALATVVSKPRVNSSPRIEKTVQLLIPREIRLGAPIAGHSSNLIGRAFGEHHQAHKCGERENFDESSAGLNL
jgi:HEAT repeat protein